MSDTYESADSTPDVSEFPTDSSTSGKHYQVAVPDYIPSTQDMSYFRHGVPHSSASAWNETTKAWSQNGHSTALGDDILQQVVPPSGFQSSLGGVRDHTDGNRVVTTRQDVIEVIAGQYRQLVLSNQSTNGDPDPDWQAPDEQTNGEEPSIVSHEYSNWYYEVISTGPQPGSGSYAEPRTKVADAQTNGWDFYEYSSANNLVDIMAAKTTLAEKMYATKMIEVMSTVHADHADWEGKISDLSDGDLNEYMLAKNITEVLKAEWNINERIEATKGGISELMLAAGGVNEITTAGGAINEMTTAGGAIHEMTAAGGAISEETLAGGLIHELTAAGGAIFEETLAIGLINEITAAVKDVNEISLAGGVLTDIMYGNTSFIDVMAATQMLVEIITAAMVVEFTTGTTVIEVTMADTKIEFDEAKTEVHAHSMDEVTTEKNKILANSTELSAAHDKISGAMTHIVDEYMIV